MKIKYAVISAITLLFLGGCAKHHADQTQSSASSTTPGSSPASSPSPAPSPQGQPTRGTQGSQPAKANLFNTPGNPTMIPISTSLQKPIPVSWYDLELIDLYMIHKAGLYGQITHNGLVMFFEPQKYGIAMNNVFDRKEIVQSVVAKTQSILSQVPTDQPFYVNTRFNFDPNYNFKAQSFKMKAFEKSSSFSFSPNMGNPKDSAILNNMMGTNKTIWPTGSVAVRFTNYKCVGNLAMPTAEAKSFLNSRTNSSGGINTSIYAKIDFVTTGYSSFNKVGSGLAPQVMSRKVIFYAKLLNVSLYNNGQDAASGGKPLTVYSCR